MEVVALLAILMAAMVVLLLALDSTAELIVGVMEVVRVMDVVLLDLVEDLIVGPMVRTTPAEHM